MSVLFKVVSSFSYQSSRPGTVFLKFNNWNDYNYYTLFDINYLDNDSNPHDLGSVRIGYFGQATELKARRLMTGTEFTTIISDFFSLGVGTEYYENLKKLSPANRQQILLGLRDLAFLPELLEVAKNEEVTQSSLFRGIDIRTVSGQYRRMALGGVKLTTFQFWYEGLNEDTETPALKLNFKVIPESNPPSNIHVIIGRNGVGKSTMINTMTQSLYGDLKNNGKGVYFQNDEKFVNVVAVAFSAFDNIKPLFDTTSPTTDIKFKYIGIKTPDEDSFSGFRSKTSDELTNEFVESFLECIKAFKTNRLTNSLRALESDQNFKEENILSLLEIKEKPKLFKEEGKRIFNKLSSGHKIILLSITRLVETVQEKSLIFIDEPEAHLHPPLLSAFTRALSELLTTINGVAIIATHSPVILQEVPRNCVYKLRRSGDFAFAERLEIESFGENVGVLTREVFSLEVTESGFYQLLKKAVDELTDYDELIDYFNDKLGMEARSIARVLFAKKNRTRNETFR